MWSVAFSADGYTLVAGGENGIIRLWEVSMNSLITRACGIVNRNLTIDEQRLYIPIFAGYQKVCPDFGRLALTRGRTLTK
jgi:hypothetical protein